MSRLPPETCISRVRLRVADLNRSLRFYRDLLGFVALTQGSGRAELAASGEPPAQVVLEQLSGARPKPPRSTGLYHVAILLPRRRELARLLRRLAAAGWSFQGFSDHGVSEAVYLADPDGNGLELYSDRPRSAWRRADGELVMFTRPLGLGDLLRELEREPERAGEPPLHPHSRIGHVHLQVADLARAERFYGDLLGFAVTTRSYPGALFLSAGGYHHHIGLNTWAGPDAPPAPPDAAGLVDFTVAVPDGDAAAEVAGRLRRSGAPVERVEDPGLENLDRWRTRDPDGTGVVIASLPAGA